MDCTIHINYVVDCLNGEAASPKSQVSPLSYKGVPSYRTYIEEKFSLDFICHSPLCFPLGQKGKRVENWRLHGQCCEFMAFLCQHLVVCTDMEEVCDTLGWDIINLEHLYYSVAVTTFLNSAGCKMSTETSARPRQWQMMYSTFPGCSWFFCVPTEPFLVPAAIFLLTAGMQGSNI